MNPLDERKQPRECANTKASGAATSVPLGTGFAASPVSFPQPFPPSPSSSSDTERACLRQWELLDVEPILFKMESGTFRTAAWTPLAFEWEKMGGESE